MEMMMLDYDVDFAPPGLLGLGLAGWIALGLGSLLLWSSIAVWFWRIFG
jgi:hypothetical protein